jgi:hypothetical protein
MTVDYQALPVTGIQPNGYVVPQPVQPARRRIQGLTILVHAPQKSGKSSLGDSAGPDMRPTLIVDVETASFWTPSRKVYWDPKRETMPTWPQDPRALDPSGYWDTCIVVIHDYQDLHSLLKTLMLGQHPFNAISMDSVTEIQQRIMNAVAGTKQMQRDDWGMLLRQINKLIRDYRDLLTHPTRPIWALTYICGTHWDYKVGKWRPLLQGASQDYAPYVPDLTGWIEVYPNGERHLWSGPSPVHETGDRLWRRLPYDMKLGYPGVEPGWTLEEMVKQVLASQLGRGT